MRLLSIVLCAVCLQTAFGEALRFSGVIGQSQPAGAIPLTSVAMQGAATDKTGALWSFSSGELRQFEPSGDSWRLKNSFKPPKGGGAPLLSDGVNLYFPASGAIWSFDTEKASFASPAPLPANCKAFALGVGKHKFLALAENAVHGFADGSWTRLFALSAPARGGENCSLCVEPNSGDLLVGSGYPTMLTRRFSLNGREIVSSSWPRAGWARYLVVADGKAWALNNDASSLPEPFVSDRDALCVGDQWSQPTNGVAIDAQSRPWLSTDQGLLGYDRDGKPLGLRVGGIARPGQMAVNDDGDLLAPIGDRIVRFPIDASESTPPTCKESCFRVGGNYQSRCRGLQWDGQAFLALDDVRKTLWRFDPKQLGWRDKPWLALTAENAFVTPKELAVGGQRVFVLDGETARYAPCAALGNFKPLRLPSPVQHLAAGKDGILYCAAGDKVRAFQIAADGAAKPLWESPGRFPDIAALAADGEHVLVAAKEAVSLLSAKDGAPTASLAVAAIPGGMRPVAICVKPPWVFVYDDVEKRIVRLRIIER